MIYLLILLFVIYGALIISLIIGFSSIKQPKNDVEKPLNTFSIIIPFRNEATNLNALLQSFLNLNYPSDLFEILLVNDASEDASEAIINRFQLLHPQLTILLLNNVRKTNSPKKDAITTAIKIATFDWIATTDADCEVPENWLQSFNSFIEKSDPVFISAPVKFKKEKTLLFHFQNLNFISLIGSTIGGFGIKKPFLCNGANLCYRKAIFKKIKGFEGNSTIASGDDIFLLEKMVENYPTKTSFLKSQEAVVITKSERSWKSFFNQQIRWASKTTSYHNWFSKFVGLTVFTTNLVIIIIGISLFFNLGNWQYFVVFLLFKLSVDFLLIEKTARFLSAKNSLRYFLFISLLYPFYTVIIACASMFKKYEWKGRVFKK